MEFSSIITFDLGRCKSRSLIFEYLKLVDLYIVLRILIWMSRKRIVRGRGIPLSQMAFLITMLLCVCLSNCGKKCFKN